MVTISPRGDQRPAGRHILVEGRPRTAKYGIVMMYTGGMGTAGLLEIVY